VRVGCCCCCCSLFLAYKIYTTPATAMASQSQNKNCGVGFVRGVWGGNQGRLKRGERKGEWGCPLPWVHDFMTYYLLYNHGRARGGSQGRSGSVLQKYWREDRGMSLCLFLLGERDELLLLLHAYIYTHTYIHHTYHIYNEASAQMKKKHSIL